MSWRWISALFPPLAAWCAWPPSVRPASAVCIAMGAHCVTSALTAAVDAIARDMKEFYIGRFDVRFSSLEELSQGRGFTIMEVNDAGSEAIQAWDPDIGLVRALTIIFAKQRLLFEIGATNRRDGHRPISLRQLAHFHFMQQRLVDVYPPSN